MPISLLQNCCLNISSLLHRLGATWFYKYNEENRKEVIIVELKNYLENPNDAPGSYEGLMIHKGSVIKHPADQVKGYTEYCRRFHSVVLDEGAEVNGCVYFTQPIDLKPYRQAL